ncbi:branched-chain amino acid ABC transporter permease [Geosporobacter ferrireducens]|uniref:ABC transporter permease n=1 Tax=Geosporobacter ferrireducens TaxID=1424294 RepID=A0A1D8GE15_9FIRM|nr:branched-chain amino acid ABC transporter permease [Geosporobacter ferrireducens]AOT69136.1 ABC transporter permease [Geosporobacter ferrireducens]MTI56812.1 branched-chain amino acid ABC transporter permease [Geosporobacter ferrireducens]
MLLQQMINGITLGSAYALTAIGYTMVFGILELVNFSHGAVYMFGAFICMMLITAFKINFFMAFLLSLVITGVLGILIDKICLYPLRIKNAPKVTSLISTIGVSIFLQNMVMLLWGSETKNFPMVLNLGTTNIMGVKISYFQLLIMAVCFILMATLTVIIQKTKMGKAMRATAQNMEAAKLMGIHVDQVISFTFFLGAALAAVAGIMIGMYYQTVDPMMGFMTGLKAFAAAVLGGIGVLPGAVIGGLLIGVIETLSAGYIHGGYRDAIAFAILIAVLMVKPTGLLGRQVQKKV